MAPKSLFLVVLVFVVRKCAAVATDASSSSASAAHTLSLHDVNIVRSASMLSRKLSVVDNDAMASEEFKAILNEAIVNSRQSGNSTTPTASSAASYLADSVGELFQQCLAALARLRSRAESLIGQHSVTSSDAKVTRCSSETGDTRDQRLRSGEHLCAVESTRSCHSVSTTLARLAGNLTEVFRSNTRVGGLLRWQYFVDRDGPSSIVEYPAFVSSTNDIRRRIQDYLSFRVQHQRHLVLALDTSGSPSAQQMALMRSVAVDFLLTLPSQIAVCLAITRLGKSSAARQSGRCVGAACVDVFVSSAEHKCGAHASFHNVASLIGIVRTASPIDDAVNIMPVIQTLTRECCGVANDTVLVLVSAAGEPRSSNNISVSVVPHATDAVWNSAVHHQLSSADQLNITRHLLLSVAGVLTSSSNTAADNRSGAESSSFSSPRYDPCTQSWSVSVLSHCWLGGQYVVGVELSLSYLAAMFPLLRATVHEASYAFIVDRRHGHVVVHPALYQPEGDDVSSDVSGDISGGGVRPLHIALVEIGVGFQQRVLSDLLALPSGVRIVKHNAVQTSHIAVYSWRTLPHTPYTICVVQQQQQQQQHINSNASDTWPQAVVLAPAVPPPSGFVYHRQMARVSQRPHAPRLCRHFHQLATISYAALFLAASAFTTPPGGGGGGGFGLCRDVTAHLAYLTDTSRLMANPGLQPVVRLHVTLLALVAPLWRRRLLAAHQHNPHVVRTYAATASGVMAVYPGVAIDDQFEPAQRRWFLDATRMPARLIVSPLFLDQGGGGYVVTVSRSVSVSPHVDFHTVMAADLTYGYVEQLVRSVVGERVCDAFTCILFDQGGYIVYHSRLMTSLMMSHSRLGPLTSHSQRAHLSSVEPLLANQLLQHRRLVRKISCNRYSDMTVQRRYMFNLTASGRAVSEQSSLGERCRQYRVTAVPSTNLLLAVVNATCRRPAFCPCNRRGRACINCASSQSLAADWQCECPCQCRLDSVPDVNLTRHTATPAVCERSVQNQFGPTPDRRLLMGNAAVLSSHTSSLACDRVGEKPTLAEALLRPQLRACVPIQCHGRRTRADCAGVLGCVWCRRQQNARALLQRPFCTDSVLCSGGVLRAPSPYSRVYVAGKHSATTLHDLAPGSATGATSAGASVSVVLACAAAVVMAVACYRRRVAAWRRHHSCVVPLTAATAAADEDSGGPPHIEPLPEPSAPAAAAAAVIGAGGGPVRPLLASPYHVPAPPRHQRRRRRHHRHSRDASPSDPGYSTMTPTPHDAASETGPIVTLPVLQSPASDEASVTSAGCHAVFASERTEISDPQQVASFASVM